MSFTKTKYDSCFLNQQKESNKSIFNYIVDNSMYINKNECNNYTAPFLTYIPSGVSSKNVDLENELKGMNRPTSKCDGCKYTPIDQTIAQNINNVPYGKQAVLNVDPNNKQECKQEYNILPDGYFKHN